jgi:tight adherence protein B
MVLVTGALAAAAVALATGDWSRAAPRRVLRSDRAGTASRSCLEVARAVLERVQPSIRRSRRDAQLPDAIDRLASALRAGSAIGPALIGLAEEVSDPLGTELRQVARAIEHGAPVSTALATWAEARHASPDVHLVAAALTLGAGAGGEVARAVDGVGATLRERHELRGEVRALATQARASAAVLAVAPLLFAVLVATLEPNAIAFLVTTPAGLGCLASGIGLEGLGMWWMARITRSAG